MGEMPNELDEIVNQIEESQIEKLKSDMDASNILDQEEIEVEEFVESIGYLQAPVQLNDDNDLVVFYPCYGHVHISKYEKQDDKMIKKTTLKMGTSEELTRSYIERMIDKSVRQEDFTY